MTEAGAEHLLSIPDGELDEYLADLSPGEVLAALDDLPIGAGELDRARTETADMLAWARLFLPELMPLMPGPHHEVLAGALAVDGPTGVRLVEGAPRGSGKSTTALALLPIVAAVRRSHRFVVLIRDNLNDAITSVNALRTSIEAHPELVDRYPWIRPIPGPSGVLELAGGMVIMARSTGSAIRGLNRTLVDGSIVRPDLVICDDLEDEESARSSLQVGRLEEWLLSAVGQLGGPPGEATAAVLDLIVIGTTLEQDALVAKMLDGDGAFGSWRRHRFPAEATVALSDDGRLVAHDRADEQTSIPVPDGAEPADRIALWPGGMPLAYLDRLTDPTDELFVGSVVYAREYLLRPTARSDVLFDARKTVWVDGLAADWLAGQLGIIERVVAVDPAVSKSDAADYTGVAVVGLVRPFGSRDDGTPWPTRIVVPFAERRRVGPGELLDWIEDVWRQWAPTGRVTFEAEGGFAYPAEQLRRNRSVPVRAVTSGGKDKRTRALPMSVWHEAGRVELDSSLRGTPTDRELHGFTGTNADEHDDLVDALVYGSAFVTRGWRAS